MSASMFNILLLQASEILGGHQGWSSHLVVALAPPRPDLRRYGDSICRRLFLRICQKSGARCCKRLLTGSRHGLQPLLVEPPPGVVDLHFFLKGTPAEARADDLRRGSAPRRAVQRSRGGARLTQGSIGGNRQPPTKLRGGRGLWEPSREWGGSETPRGPPPEKARGTECLLGPAFPN